MQLMSALFLLFENTFFGLSLGVVGATLVLISLATFKIKKKLRTFYLLTTVLFLLLLAISITWGHLHLLYVLFIVLFSLCIILSPFSARKLKRKLPKTIVLEQNNQEKKETEKVFALKTGSIYHRADCPLIQKSKKKNLIVFESAKVARARGYRPCKMCLPQ